MYKHTIKVGVLASAIFALAGCGGGGGSTPAAQTTVTAAVSSFPLQSGYKARVASGSVANVNVSGSCTGSGTFSESAPASGSFEGSPALAVTATFTLSLSNCTPATQASTDTTYYDTNYSPIGSITPGAEYDKFAAPLPIIPTSVKIGDTATLGTNVRYSDSTKSTILGQSIFSYVVESDGTSNNTAVINLITKRFNQSNALLSTSQGRYRITADGTLSLLTIDVQYSTTSTAHLIYTAK